MLREEEVRPMMDCDDVPIVLRVPRDELLIMQYGGWCDILAGVSAMRRGASPQAVLPFEESRETIFDVEGYEESLQAVVDRIEPAWVVDP